MLLCAAIKEEKLRYYQLCIIKESQKCLIDEDFRVRYIIIRASFVFNFRFTQILLQSLGLARHYVSGD